MTQRGLYLLRLARSWAFSAALVVAASGLLGGAIGCGTRAVGAAGDAGDQDPDSAVHEDAGVRPDASQAALWGTVVYRDERREAAAPLMSAQLAAAFFEVDYGIGEAMPSGYVETRVTYDNVECDIYFTAPRWGGGPPPLPPEPEQVDAGEIRLESAFDAEGAFVVSWQGTGYSVDDRPSALAALPGWVVPDTLQALVVFVGSARLPAGSQRVSLVGTPTLTEPVGDDVVQPDVNGLFRIAWDADPDLPVQLRLDMNMDWDNATFICRPPPGQGEVYLPQTWLNDYSWGSAEVRVIGRQDERIGVGSLDLRIRARRTTYRYVQFEIVW